MTAADPERGICDDPPCMTILQHTTVIAFSKIWFFFLMKTITAKFTKETEKKLRD